MPQNPAVALSLCAALVGGCAAPDSASDGDSATEPTSANDSTTNGGTLVCEPPGPADLSTRHLRIENHTGGEICAGTLEALDQEVDRLLTLMNLPLDSPIVVHYGEEAVAGQCAAPLDPEYIAGGCAPGFGCDTRAVVTFRSQVHELVHAVRRRNEVWGPPVIEEGLATILGSERPLRAALVGVSQLPKPDLTELLERPGGLATSAEYAYGGHFLLHCIEGYGLERVMAAVTDPQYPEDLPALFEKHLGDPFEEIEQGWKDDGWGELYVSPLPCENLVDLGDGFSAAADLHCGSTTTLGHSNLGMASRPFGTCFVVGTPTEVTVVTDGAAGDVNLVGYNCNPDDTDNQDLVNGIRLPTGRALDMTLARCTWLIDFDREWDAGTHTMSVTLQPT